MGAPVVTKTPDTKSAASGSAPSAARSSSSAPSSTPVNCPHCGKSFIPEGAGTATADEAAASASTTAEPPGGKPASGAAPLPRTAGRKTILVAEDTEFFLELVKETLGAQYRMLGARTKTEALELLGREPIDLVILDLTLEKSEDGLEVLANAEPLGLPCLIFTAGNEADLWGDGWTRLQAKGATDLLLKGMNIEEQLLNKVAALLASNN
jgi:CheY-like chemotaxis protein